MRFPMRKGQWPSNVERMSMSRAIAYCFDRNFAPYAAVSTYSLLANTPSAPPVHWLVPAEDASLVAPVLEGLKRQTGHDLRLLAAPSGVFAGWDTHLHLSSAAYLRLLLPDLIAADRLLYIDCDTLVLGDLGELFKLELGGNLLAAALQRLNPGQRTFSKIPRAQNDPNINSGLMVLDLQPLRDAGLLRACEQIYARHRQDVVFADQCLINKFAENRKLVLDGRWNHQIFSNSTLNAEFRQALEGGDLRMLHFVGSVKPWQQMCNPVVAEPWWRYARKLDFMRIEPLKMTNIGQAIALANCHDLNGMYQEASMLKGQIIAMVTRRPPST